MRLRSAAIFFSLAALLAAPKKNIATAHGENEDILITVTLYGDGPAVKELLGNDLDGHYMVADVKIEPKYGKEATVSRDDFLLRADDDGDHSPAFTASQIAGRTSLVLKRTPGQGGAVANPDYSGMPVPYGYPGGYPGGMSVGGGGGARQDGLTAEMKQNVPDGQENPLEKLLNEKILPEKKTDQPVTGLLYFAIEKHKIKDMELRWGGKDNRITIRFNK
jgi:hypothetical protein